MIPATAVKTMETDTQGVSSFTPGYVLRITFVHLWFSSSP